MGKTYEKAPRKVVETIGEVLRRYHTDLCNMKLRVDALLVHAPLDAEGCPAGPALTSSGGYPALAKVKVTPLKDRVLGRGDCEIMLDGDRYPKWNDDVLRCLIDHEIEHLEFTGNVDDIGRPKLRLRPHDVEFGWFDAVARRHGDHSCEVRQAKGFFGNRSLRQLYMPGWEDMAPAESSDDTIQPSIPKAKAAQLLRVHFMDEEIKPGSLTYVSVPHLRPPDDDGEEAGIEIVEGWVDLQDRAVIFTAGQVITITPALQLSARWTRGDAA